MPDHPGAILREDVLPALDMTQGVFAQRLGVSRLSVSDLLHGKRAMTPEMAALANGCRSPALINAVLMTGEAASNHIGLSASCNWKVLYKPVNLQALLSAM